MSRALATLARLRKLEAGQARHALGEALARERHAEDASARACAQCAQEAEAARAHTGDPAGPLAGAYSAWLPAAAKMVAAAHHDEAAAHDARARTAAILAAKDAALDAVKTLLDLEDKLTRRQAARRAQHRLDELASRRTIAATAGPHSDAADDRRSH